MRKVFSIPVFFFCFLVYSQNIDSLRLVLKNAKHDTTRVKTLNYWSLKIFSSQPDSSLLLCTHAKKLAEKNLNIMRVNLSDEEAFFMEYYFRKNLGESALRIGVLNFNKGKMEAALTALEYSLKIRREMLAKSNTPLERHESKQGMALSYNNLGEFYRRKGMMKEAMENYTSSLKIKEGLLKEKLSATEIKQVKITIAYTLNNIAIIYLNQGKPDEALAFWFKSMKLNKELGEKDRLAFNYTNIAGVYSERGLKKEA
ncbi:MAG: tetratricopeptide repeat protein, partial [Bacteroidia bacterium]|nr:tetratricopeptide repeat protein [Bacteroidia bacterium]